MARRDDNIWFTRLISPMLNELRRIFATARSECTLDDLKAEAWIAAVDFCNEHGGDVAPEDRVLQLNVLRTLWRKFGRFANRTTRTALRIDQNRLDDDGNICESAIAAVLAAPDHYEPDQILERREVEARKAQQLTGRFTEAVAWLHALEHFDHDLSALGRHLALSVATLKARLKHAQCCAACQSSLFDGITAIPEDFQPQQAIARPRIRTAHPRMHRFCAQMHAWQMHLFCIAGAVFNRG